MFYAARKEQKKRSTFSYSGEYLKGENACQNSNNNVVFGILKQ